MMPAAAFAADVPVLLTASEAGVDVTVSENITLTSQAGSADFTVSDLTVKNNATIGSVEVTGISASAENGWSLVPADSGFEAMQANAKKLYLGYGSHDFSTGAFNVSDMDIAPGQTETISLDAKTGIVTSDISAQKVATVVVTIGLKNAVQLVSFTIDASIMGEGVIECQAEEGMTWLAWVNSGYNNTILNLKCISVSSNYHKIITGDNTYALIYNSFDVVGEDLIIANATYICDTDK